MRCLEVGIELCVVDISSQSKFTEKSSQKFLEGIKSIIDKVKLRHTSGGAGTPTSLQN